MKKFNELEYLKRLDKVIVTHFLNEIDKFEASVTDELLCRGYSKVNCATRTVTFTFGDVEITRSRWYKGKQCYIPVDDYLDLDRYSRYSKEFMYLIAALSAYLPYRKVADVINRLLRVNVTKDTVLQAVKKSQQLFNEQEDYRFFEEPEVERKAVDVLYIEGDGVLVKATDKAQGREHNELTHFVVHEGSEKITNQRNILKHKKEFISTSHKEAKSAVLDYIYNHYIITDNTKFITTADGGFGYSPAVFKEMAKGLRIQNHEHFVDSYHVNMNIQKMYRFLPKELKADVFKAIRTNDKKLLKITLDKTESLIIDNDGYLEEFQVFSRRMMTQFHNMIPPKVRGMSSAGIGIIESQHRKITSRMKKRGMYWSKEGADRMAKLILKVDDGSIRDLFFGDWRNKYLHYKEMEVSGADILMGHSKSESSGVIKGKILCKKSYIAVLKNKKYTTKKTSKKALEMKRLSLLFE